MNTSNNDASPKRGDAAAKEWAHDLAQSFGEAVKYWRNALELTAVELSNRTREIGYPITRATIAKIENNQRNSKMDVAEVLTLAAALRVAPIDLIFPGFPDGDVRATQRVTLTCQLAQAWFTAHEDYDVDSAQLVGGPHSPEIYNSIGIRRAVSDYSNTVQAISQLDEIKDAEPFPSKEPIEIEGAETYKSRVEHKAMQVELNNGTVAYPVWFQRLVEPSDAQG